MPGPVQRTGRSVRREPVARKRAPLTLSGTARGQPVEILESLVLALRRSSQTPHSPRAAGM